VQGKRSYHSEYARSSMVSHSTDKLKGLLDWVAVNCALKDEYVSDMQSVGSIWQSGIGGQAQDDVQSGPVAQDQESER